MTTPASDAPAASSAGTLNAAVQAHLGVQLRALYGDPTADLMPQDLRQLASRVAQVIRAHTEPVNQAYIDCIMRSLSPLRAFAISLAKDRVRAEDLVQDTVLRAISKQEKFEAGTNLQAWLFTILRNSFFSTQRKRQREVEDADGALAVELITIPDQEDKIIFQELEAALARLPQDQREAIMLVVMEGMSYEDAAAIVGCAVGTIKSRVNRARTKLAELLHVGPDDLGGKRIERL
jgi:RNA polymerase sigma-70 factor (ECF subfamily)